MNTFKARLYYYVGHAAYLIGLKHWWIPGFHYIYSYCMTRSSDLDTENKVWKPIVEGKDGESDA